MTNQIQRLFNKYWRTSDKSLSEGLKINSIYQKKRKELMQIMFA